MMHTGFRSAMIASSAIVCALAAPAYAQTKSFDIPAQPVQTAISALGRQAGIQIIAARNATQGKRANAVRGNMTVTQALDRLLQGTGLVARQTGAQTFTVVAGRQADAAPPAAPTRLADAASDELDAGEQGEILVTASRIQRGGFDAPTPTTVLGTRDLAQGARASIGETLNDLPQFRATMTPVSTVGSSFSGVALADLRGLGFMRTLTLLNGHRFTGANDLSIVPQDLIKRVDVVTGGASAAWGSGAVAGVVNIILDDDLTGFRAGVDAGVSSRGDAARYGANLAWGTKFAGDRGHFMIAGSYLDNQGAPDRSDRRFLDASIFQRANGDLVLARDVNSVQLFDGGTVISPLTGETLFAFSPSGALTAFPYGSETFGASTIGGGGQGFYDRTPTAPPYERTNIFARASYELTDTMKLWAEGSFGRNRGSYSFFAEPLAVAIAPDNAFLSPAARAQITAAGVPADFPFLLGRYLSDVGGPNRYLGFRVQRRNLEGAIGLDGSIGAWKYGLYYDHGELRDSSALFNQQIMSRFNNGVDSVLVGGVATCRINADADATNNDPGCVPINLLGKGNISAQAGAWAFGTAHSIATTKLDAAGVNAHGQLFSTWAGPVDIAFGADLRWEKIVTNFIDPISAAKDFSILNASVLDGGFSVKEFFGEVNVPLLDVADVAKLEVNGAARYSDYSTSGGIWTWKAGGTLRLFNDLLLRGVYSRDIRSPNISEYFTQQDVIIGPVVDPYTGTSSNAAMLTGGNPDLTPEIAHTLTLGASYSPKFARGLRLSIDYYDIDIRNVIASLTAQDTLDQCFLAFPGDPSCGGVITRTPTNTTISGTYRNLARYRTRGLDIEASYVVPLGSIAGNAPGSLRFRAFATHVMDLIIDDGVRTSDNAGIVGDTATFGVPKWRVTASAGYESDSFSGDVRVRHVAGGRFADLPIVNNRVSSQTYVDLDLRFTTGAYTFFTSVTNLFDATPKYVTTTHAINYDVIGTYASAGVKLKF
jgi:outer membrane receptor protein involved in Fe transport